MSPKLVEIVAWIWAGWVEIRPEGGRLTGLLDGSGEGGYWQSAPELGGRRERGQRRHGSGGGPGRSGCRSGPGGHLGPRRRGRCRAARAAVAAGHERNHQGHDRGQRHERAADDAEDQPPVERRARVATRAVAAVGPGLGAVAGRAPPRRCRQRSSGGLGQLHGRLVALVDVLGHPAGDHRVEGRGNVRCGRRRLRRRGVQVRVELLFQAVAGEGPLPGEALVQHAGQRIDVGAVIRCAPEALGRQIGDGAHRGSRAGERGVGHRAGQAEVDQVDEVPRGWSPGCSWA